MMCAAVAGARGRRVLLIDHSERLAEKIRISGGGRCNFTNLNCSPANFLSQNPDFCRSALARYTPQDFIELVNRHGIGWHEKTLGQLFCDDSSQAVIDMLVAECEDACVMTWRPCKLLGVRAALAAEGDAPRFVLETTRGEVATRALVVATGGLAIPQIGATPLGYQLAEQFGLSVIAPKPALVPLTLDAHILTRFVELAGVSCEARVSLGKQSFRENILLTHRGLSGPAILQISSYWQGQGAERTAIEIDLLPDVSSADWMEGAQGRKTQLANLLAEHLPQRFARAWSQTQAENADTPFNQLPKAHQQQLAHSLKHWRIQPSGTLGYRKAEVTLGGVDTRELSSRTLEALRVPGLYFIGEVVDVTGHLGGFNFQWAWASGQAAGRAV